MSSLLGFCQQLDDYLSGIALTSSARPVYKHKKGQGEISKMFRHAIPLIVLGALAGVGHTDDKVVLQATPNGGIRPLAGVDGGGVVHVVYGWKPTPAERGPWDTLQYVRKGPEQREFSSPILVNSIPHSVFGTTPADLAVGRDGRVHVAWAG